MKALRSAVYAGVVTHRRLRPKQHKLKYRIFMFLLDLDELPALHERLRLFSLRRFNLFSFHERDHGGGTEGSLRDWVETHLASAGIDIRGGPIRLLAMPRIFGYGFNPISIYFCYHRDGRLVALLHEVNNTFGERHGYLIPVAAESDAAITQTCAKEFHVSPFMAMGMTYDFRLRNPDERFAVTIRGRDKDGLLLVATFSSVREEMTDAVLLRAFFRTPLLTLKVIGGIHWEALRLWRKGLRAYTKPPAPAYPVSIVALTEPVRFAAPETTLTTA